MKTTFFKPTLFTALTLAVLIFSCKKDDDDKKTEPIPVTPTTAKLDVHFHSKVGDAGFALNQEYTMVVGGETITYDFSRAAFYVSGITLHKMDGGSTSFENKYLLVKPDQDEYTIGQLAPAHYTGIRFNVGVDAANNHADPATFEAGHPLAIQNPSMHWNWNPGYLFMALEGSFSATSGESGTFTYHIGLDDLLRTVEIDFHHHLEVTAGKEAIVHMEIDYAELLNGVDLRTENFTKSMAASERPLAEKIANNISSAIHME
jgi:hypothetical protein